VTSRFSARHRVEKRVRFAFIRFSPRLQLSRDFYFQEKSNEDFHRRAISIVRRNQHRARAIEYSIAVRRAASNTFRNINANSFNANSFAGRNAD
jgi:hypothetical protein